MKASSLSRNKVDYGVDAPAVMRNFFLIGATCLALALLLPQTIHLGRTGVLYPRPMFFWPAGVLLAEGFLFLLYVKYGKFRHRDFMLSLHSWRGDEQVLDVGCGRGLLLAGAAKHLSTGHATGIDIWSSEDMGSNSLEATRHNLLLEGVQEHCTLLSEPAQDMGFAASSFDVVLCNLCLHNIYDKSSRTQALKQISRVLKPGGVALLSDYKLTGEYAEQLTLEGLHVTRHWGSLLTTFPPLRVVVAHKPAE